MLFTRDCVHLKKNGSEKKTGPTVVVGKGGGGIVIVNVEVVVIVVAAQIELFYYN